MTPRACQSGSMASNTQLLSELDSVNRRLSNTRKKASDKLEQAVTTAGVVAGGAGAGWVDAKYGDKKIAGVGVNLVVGMGLTAVGLMEWAGRQSNVVGAVGTGMLSYEAGKEVRERTLKSSSSSVQGVGAQQLHGRQQQRPMNVRDLQNAFAGVRAG